MHLHMRDLGGFCCLLLPPLTSGVQKESSAPFQERSSASRVSARALVMVQQMSAGVWMSTLNIHRDSAQAAECDGVFVAKRLTQAADLLLRPT